MNDESKRWIEAGKIVCADRGGADPTTHVLCPRCQTYPLSVTDQPLDVTRKERHLRCPKCGGYNSIRMSA